jgi:hypothetical protein
MSEVQTLYPIRKKGLYGFINSSGAVVAEPVYTMSYFLNGYGVIEKNDLQGLIETNGKILMEPEYERIVVLSKNIFGVRKNGKYALFSSGKQLTDFIYSWVSSFSEGLALASDESSAGYINEKGEKEIPFVYSNGDPFLNGSAMVLQSGRYGLINRKGLFITKVIYDWYKKYEKGYIVNIGGKILDEECSGGKFGLLSESGEEIAPMIYDDIAGFFDGCSSVCIGKLFGSINEEGKLIAPVLFNQRVKFSEGLAPVQKDFKYGYVDLNNKLVIKHDYRWAGPFVKGIANVTLDESDVFINKEGNIVSDPVEAKLSSFRENSWIIHKDKLYGLLNPDGSVLIPVEYESISNFYPSGFAWAKRKGLFGIINKKNKFVVPPSFKLKILYPILEDHTHIEMEGKSGLYDVRHNRWLLEPEYDSIGVFKGALVELQVDGKIAYANKEGKIVWME